ncbi:MAG: GlsB/YeaQ/YmgE family stress response membrane protein [Clostridium sp.]|uniref:GlsB/YeaQ/YmgE family stress response membrane protein n=1 Tax=Clostridium sp. TaxID=1506 RepID=UPI00290827D6|nr:GlsB/YeaQ/YmgE family stress response membrane protein [Clostridium sp.]MDU7338045.1 GlsB/YeaQ/YmgE family stress response membrane protein [Clostridium sp.]
MGILAWVIIGALAGWIASKFMDTDASMGAFANIVVGIVGAMIGGFIMNMLGGVGITGFNLWSLLVSVIGSVILLWILRMFKNR